MVRVIMSSKRRSEKKFFTVEEANARLPLVRAIVSDMVILARDLQDRRQRLASLLERRKPTTKDAYSEELSQMVESMEKDESRLHDLVEELEQLGVEAKGAAEGLVDFPGFLEGREVCLCWKLGEPEVLYWHEINAGFPGRQPLVIGAGIEGKDEINHE
jgi:hypothetical protein